MRPFSSSTPCAAADRLEDEVEAVRGALSSRPSSCSSSSGGTHGESSSRERIALAKDSLKVRPIAIASPTDCMCVVRCPMLPGNFSKAKRGIFVTT